MISFDLLTWTKEGPADVEIVGHQAYRDFQPGERPSRSDTERRGVSQAPADVRQRLAIALHVPAARICTIVKSKRAVTAGTALRLARFFDRSRSMEKCPP